MLEHCIFATFGKDFKLAAVTAYSKKLEKSTFLVCSTVEQAIGQGNPRAAACILCVYVIVC